MATEVTPTPPPGSLAKVQRMDSVLGDLGHRIGLWLSHPHMLTVSSLSNHPAPGLALALIVLALCGVVLSLPAGVWMYKRRHHLRSSIRGVISWTVWKERWKWHKYVGGMEIAGMPAPKPIAGWKTRAGTTLLLRFDGGQNLDTISNKAAWEVASSMRCPITYREIHHNPGRCFVDLQRRDALARAVRLPLLAGPQRPAWWKFWAKPLPVPEVNFCSPIPVAFDTNGQPVMLDLREKNMLVAGIMGSGKSWFLHVLIAYAALDRRVKIHMLDGKMGTGFKVWKSACANFATDDTPEKAMAIVEMLHGKLNKIFARMDANDERSIDWNTTEEVHLLVVDEYTAFLRIKGFETALNELIRRGRAGGVIVVLATQRPSAKVMDTDLSRLIEWRMALLCADKDSSKMALGSSVVDASTFSGKNPGEGWLLAEGRTPVRCRGYSLTDRDLVSLAAWAKRLRSKNDATNGSARNDVAHSGAANGSETPTPVRSPISPLSLVPSPSPSPSPVPSSPSQPLPAVSPGLRPTLTFIAFRGPQVASGDIQSGLGISSSTQLNRCNRLSALGYVYGARRAAKPGRGAGGRDPMLWSITDLGTAALTAKPAKEAGAQ